MGGRAQIVIYIFGRKQSLNNLSGLDNELVETAMLNKSHSVGIVVLCSSNILAHKLSGKHINLRYALCI